MTTRSPSTAAPRWSPTSAASTSSSSAARATSTAATARRRLGLAARQRCRGCVTGASRHPSAGRRVRSGQARRAGWARGRGRQRGGTSTRRACRSPRPSVVGRRPGPQGRSRRSATRRAGDRPRRCARRARVRRAPAGSPCARRAAPPRPRAPASPGSARLIELHAFNTAGDAAVAISLAGTPVLPGADRRGARPGGAVPRPDDAAVRDRGAADRPVPRPVQPRPPLGDRRDDGDPRLPVLGAGRRGHQRARRWLFPAALGVLVVVQGVRRHAGRRRTPPAAPRTSPWSRPTAGSRWPASSAPAISAPLAGAGVAWSGRSGRCATRSCSSCSPPICAIRLPAAGRLRARARASCPGAARSGSTSRRGRLRIRIPGSVAFALRANCGPRWLSGFLTDVHGVPAAREPDRATGSSGPSVLIGIVIGAAGLGNTLGIASRPRCCKRITPAMTVVLALVADAVAVAAGRAVLRRAGRWRCSA